MTESFCAREADVLALVAIGQWPRQANDALVAHVKACAACSDALVVSLACAGAADVPAAADLPDAAAAWQRAQLRAREDALRVAARPVLAAQAVAAAGLLGVVGLSAAWLAGEVPSSDAIVAMVTERASAAVSRVAGLSLPAMTGGEQIPGLAWILSALLGGVGLAVGLALLLSTLVDRLPDRSVR